jgi:diguanylate cyclase (GGDEF)-like protein/PAS domain S-box-containing protein
LAGRTIGVLSRLFAGTYFGSVVSSVGRAVAASGGGTVAIQTQGINGTIAGQAGTGDLGVVGWEGIDGFVVITDSAPRHWLDLVRDAGKPLVLISHREPGFAFPVVQPDNRSGAVEAVGHLLAHGHKAIAFAGDLSAPDVQERYEAYKEALQGHGIEPRPSLLYLTPDLEVGSGRDVAKKMIAAGLPSTAVFAAADYTAISLIETLKEAGYTVPHDQAVVGFDDMPETDLMSPALSTVAQDFDAVGREAVNLLVRRFNGEDVPCGTYTVRTSFVKRESCGCATSLRPLSHQDRGADPVETFVRDVCGALRHPTPGLPGAKNNRVTLYGQLRSGNSAGLAPSGVPEVARGIAREFLTAAERPLTDLELLRLQQLSEHLYDRDSGQRAFSVISLSRALARRLESELGPPTRARSGRLEDCVQQVVIGLARAGVIERLGVGAGVQQGVLADYNVSMELLRGHEKDPRSLEWMAQTRARAGVLALWTGGAAGTGHAQLEVAGSYDSRGGAVTVAQGQFDLEAFPMCELLGRAQTEPDSLVMVLPLQTPVRDWGYLALVISMDAFFISQDIYGQWAALLGQALGHDAATTALRQRNEELAYSYRREREMAAAIKQSEERYALAARAANDGLWDWDLISGTIYFSTRWKVMLGFSEDAIGDTATDWLDRVHPDDIGALRAELDRLIGGDVGPFENEHRVLAGDGTYRWVLCRGLGTTSGKGEVTRLVGSLSDVTERRRLEDQLLQQALYDSLTGLPNRTLFLDRLSQAIAHSRRNPEYGYAVLWLDLDRFKMVNDSLGHLAGDGLLVAVAKRVSARLRAGDTAARFGGDEFAVLLNDLADPAPVERVAERLETDLAEPYDLDGHEVVLTASIGITTSAYGYERAEDILRDVDTAMYRAKSRGRAGSTMFDPSMHAKAMTRLQTEADLRQAADRGEFELHYQPIVELGKGHIRGLEALIRWRHPARGLLPPAEFLTIAEESGLIVPMGRWAMTTACRQLVGWKAAGLVPEALRVSVNLSNREFWSPGLLGQLDRATRSSGVPTGWLAFEVTESVLMEDLEGALRILGELRTRGVQIHIDHFGTGYSSLEALHRLPIDALKMDRCFVAHLAEGKSTEVVRTILQLARNLGVQVIAEGIETAAQQGLLVGMGCELGQGYWFSRPQPPTGLAGMLRGTPAAEAARRVRRSLPETSAIDGCADWSRPVRRWHRRRPTAPQPP